jgi:hypothetical protein
MRACRWTRKVAYIAALSRSHHPEATSCANHFPFLIFLIAGKVKFDAKGEPIFVLPTKAGSVTEFRVREDKPAAFLLSQLSDEDASLADANLYSIESAKASGGKEAVVRIARSTPLSQLLRDGFSISSKASETSIIVPAPEFEDRVHHLKTRLAEVEKQLVPLAKTKAVCDLKAKRFSNFLVWSGLFGLCGQWGLMANLTWWTYSWGELPRMRSGTDAMPRASLPFTLLDLEIHGCAI